MKVMATAQRTFAVKGNNDAFLRCDYRILMEDNDDVTAPLKEYIRILPDKEQDFILELHNDAIEWGMTCKIDVFFLIIRFVYYYKNKEIWSFSMSVDSGFRILIKTKNTHLYADIIQKFPLPLQEKIAVDMAAIRSYMVNLVKKDAMGLTFL